MLFTRMFGLISFTESGAGFAMLGEQVPVEVLS
jgi:hypothetical protein